MKQRHLKLKQQTRRRLSAVFVVLLAFVFGLIGYAALQATRAATYAVNKEAETAAITGKAAVSGQSGTSGGSAVRFGATPYDASKRIFTGNFDTGNASQWGNCQNRVYNGACRNWAGTQYMMQFTSAIKRQGSHAARFEIHDGDIPNFGGGERTEVAGPTWNVGGGVEHWYAWSTMFDQNFTDETNKTYGVVDQWHDMSNSSPPVGFYTDVGTGQWGLRVNRQSSPGNFIDNAAIWKGSLAHGTWQDIKIHIKWSTSDSVGFVELWHNGVRQTFVGRCAGQTRCMGRTLTPGGGDAVYFKQGIYRGSAATGTDVLFKDGFVAATAESGLGDPYQ